jgi:hypothetical protein
MGPRTVGTTPPERLRTPAGAPASTARAPGTKEPVEPDHARRRARARHPLPRPRRCRSCCGCRRSAAVGRVVSLLALDFAGVAFAIFTALILKEAVHGQVDATHDYDGTKQFLPFAFLLTALLFANSGLYAERSQRPGLTRIVGSLFEVAVVALIFAVVNGEHFSSYYLFYGSLAFAIFYVARCAASTTSSQRRCCVPRAISAGRCSSGAASRSPMSHTPSPTGPLADRGRRLPLADAAAGERAALARLARGSRRGPRVGASTR